MGSDRSACSPARERQRTRTRRGHTCNPVPTHDDRLDDGRADAAGSQGGERGQRQHDLPLRAVRSMRPRVHPPATHGAGAREAGFVLVGVVMFVLALTILGLSLFALSSYEGQFVGQSYSSTQAFDTAMSGLEHAKFVLSRTRLMQNVGTS